MDLERELEEALRISRLAGDLALSHFARPPSMRQKKDLSPVTEADLECESLISRNLAEQFPADGILGEEGAFKESRSGRQWIIDPIDGTRDFVRRTPYWATQLALAIDGEIVLGVIKLPYLNEILHAVKGEGCYWNHTRVSASSVSALDQAILLISGFQSAWHVWPAETIRQLTQCCWTVRAYGACYDITMIARGKADVWLSGNGMPWDYAPPLVIARECGAAFLTRDGRGRIDSRHCVISAPGLKSAVCSLLEVSG